MYICGSGIIMVTNGHEVFVNDLNLLLKAILLLVMPYPTNKGKTKCHMAKTNSIIFKLPTLRKERYNEMQGSTNETKQFVICFWDKEFFAQDLNGK